jgi:prephenate dehydrogenase
MAGSHFSGFKYSRATLFKGAPMVLVPPVFDDMMLLDRVKAALAPCEFGRFSVTTAQQHDKMIAFTSQLPHIASNAFIKSPTALEHKGFSAGSFLDMTRVARMNEVMWTELFLENREPLLFELNSIINSLSEYRDAIENGDADRLRTLLKDGREAKERVDG